MMAMKLYARDSQSIVEYEMFYIPSLSMKQWDLPGKYGIESRAIAWIAPKTTIYNRIEFDKLSMT